MNHQPKQLALLISLIGLGVSPYAQASVEVHVVDGLPSLLGMRCSEAGAAALPFCGKTPGLVWQAQRSPLDLSGTPGALVLYSAPRNGWSPAAAGDLGEWKPRAQGKPFKITAKSKTRKSASVVTVAAVEPPHAPARKHSGKSRRVRASARIVVTAQVDAQAVQRIESPQVGQASVLPPVTGPSPEAQRLLDNLIAVLSESPALPETAAVEPAPAAKAAPVERVARMQDAHAAQLVDRPEVAVESQSTKVLRNLGAILSDDRDEVGAIRTDAAQSVASTQGVRVPGMLGEISAPETPAVEDGPTRRLRKLAARAAKAEAKAAAEAVAVGVVDVMLPLDLPTGAPLPASTAAAVPTESAPMPIGAQAELPPAVESDLGEWARRGEVEPARIVVTAQVDAQAVQRIESPQVGQASVLPPVTGPSPEAQRLLDNLIAVLSESPALPETAAVEPAPAAKAAPVERVARMQDAHAAQLVDRPEVAVESQSTKVLRNLGAILSDDRDEVGAIRTDAAQSVASTQGVRVPGMLGEISAPETPAVEDGPTRRLRKLAARAAKAEAKAAAEAVAVGVVDVMLPLDLPTGAPLPASTAAAVPTELAPMPIGAQAERGKRASPFGDGQVAVAETSLDRVRGGFSVNGLNISFGIERAVYINGSLVTSTSMNVTELGQVVAGRGLTTLDAGTIALIQNGSGNSVATGSLSPTTIGTVIQNTLDGQKIQNVTVINATANSLGMFRSLNLHSSLRGAVIDSLRR
ncbi:MAG: hypothetical protein V4540_09525 [Pseudomonadota bacterium]